jgi:hypothetical protein
MLRQAGRVATAPRVSVGDGAALGGGVALSWRAFALAALLALVLGAVLHQDLGGGRTSLAPRAVRSHESFSHESLLRLPLSAQGPVSAALGADAAAYRVSAEQGGFGASSPAQRLSARFTRSGVSVRSGAAEIALSLTAAGYGSMLTSVGTVAPSAHRNRVAYGHPGVSEWYSNGPLGIEQGFTIARAPATHLVGPLTLQMALSGNAKAVPAKGGKDIRWLVGGRTVLRYTGLTATDTHGRLLHSWLQLRGGRLLLRVDARGAHFPIRIDPFIQQGEELTALDEVQGASIALSANGDTALIGNRHAGGSSSNPTGEAWVFTRSGATWTQQGPILTDGEADEAAFGMSVALSADGNTALIGAPQSNAGTGRAWVFTRAGSTWTRTQQFIGGRGIREDFGISVALSADGNTALIGTATEPREEGGGVGAAWIFTRSGETWTQPGYELTDTEPPIHGEFGYHDGFGLAVALSGDGATALVGLPQENAVWVFARVGDTWSQQGQPLKGSGEAPYYGYPGPCLKMLNPRTGECLHGNADFGSSMALSYDGDTAVIGGPGDGGAGSAWVFTRSGETWSQQGEKLTGEYGGAFGESVALSGDGNTALIGVPGGNPGGGAIFMFTRSGNTWTRREQLLTGRAPRLESQEVGEAVALSADGNTAVTAASRRNGLLVFAYGPGPPGVVTEPASSLTELSASMSGILNATVNPDAETVTGCHFEYGPTSSYGTSVECSELPGSGESPVAVSAPVTDLHANQTYHFRVVATNALGTSYGNDQTAPYPTVQSAGPTAGQVEIVSSRGTPISGLKAEELNPNAPPPTGVALVGAVSYRISDLTPGASIYVTLRLPPESEPTEVYKLVSGFYVNITSLATFSGNYVTLHLTDGGLGDADNEANGVIVDPVVPVHTNGVKLAQELTFTTKGPVTPSVGSEYTIASAATSGLPVSFAIDFSSTPGACVISGATVSFTGFGTCIIDANQAGNATYLAAPQVQQTVQVGSQQSIAFSHAAPANPNAGSVYPVSASATSGLPVSFSIDLASTKKACTISGGVVSFKKAGTCIIDANQAGNASYWAAPQVRQTITIITAQASTTTTLTLTSPTVAYGSEQNDKVTVTTTAAGGGTIPKGKVTVKAGTATLCKITLVNGTGSCTPKATALKAGSYSVTAMLSASSNFGGSTSNAVSLDVT